jgi:hypothetical protein
LTRLFFLWLHGIHRLPGRSYVRTAALHQRNRNEIGKKYHQKSRDHALSPLSFLIRGIMILYTCNKQVVQHDKRQGEIKRPKIKANKSSHSGFSFQFRGSLSNPRRPRCSFVSVSLALRFVRVESDCFVKGLRYVVGRVASFRDSSRFEADASSWRVVRGAAGRKQVCRFCRDSVGGKFSPQSTRLAGPCPSKAVLRGPSRLLLLLLSSKVSGMQPAQPTSRVRAFARRTLAQSFWRKISFDRK